MKKAIIIMMCILFTNTIFSQKVMTRSGEVKFEASMPAFEEIAAITKTASCILDASNGNFAALVLIKSFKFKSPLMEEHWIWIGIKASFKGTIANFDATKLSTTKSTYDLEGDLTLHGVTKKIKTKISLVQNGNKISTTSIIVVKPQDYNIEIPNLVKDKIAENVKITINFILEAN